MIITIFLALAWSAIIVMFVAAYILCGNAIEIFAETILNIHQRITKLEDADRGESNGDN